MNSVNPLSLPPASNTVVLTDYSARPGDVMTVVCHGSGQYADNERILVWRSPIGTHVATIGFVDEHPWYPSHKTTVLLSDEKGVPGSGDPQPGSAIGLVDHRTAAEARYADKHPCEKPLAMMEHIVAASSRPGAVVLDCFMGSGATGEAALRLGRKFIGIEADASYFRGASERLENVIDPRQRSLF